MRQLISSEPCIERSNSEALIHFLFIHNLLPAQYTSDNNAGVILFQFHRCLKKFSTANVTSSVETKQVQLKTNIGSSQKVQNHCKLA